MTSKTPSIPQAQAAEIRRLAHDLSNALEIVVQASFLLNTVVAGEAAQQWMKLLDQGVQQAAKINVQLRDYIIAHS